MAGSRFIPLTRIYSNSFFSWLSNILLQGFPSDSGAKNPPSVQETKGTEVPSLGREDPLEEGMQPLQDSCLETPMDRGAWRAAACRVAKSQTRLKRLSTHPQHSTRV